MSKGAIDIYLSTLLDQRVFIYSCRNLTQDTSEYSPNKFMGDSVCEPLACFPCRALSDSTKLKLVGHNINLIRELLNSAIVENKCGTNR